MSPAPVPQWSTEQLDAEREIARELYRKARIDEPAELYSDEYEAAYQAVATLLEMSVDLRQLRDVLPEIVRHGDLWRALRYTAGPPISDDDLKTVADVELTRRFLRDNPAAFDAIADSLAILLDRKRFPWVLEDRDPTGEERDIALVATAASDAYQRVQAIRRNQARRLEKDVADALFAAGCEQVAKREVVTAAHWPKPGEFCGEQQVAGRQADLIATLYDGRYMPIECKVSGSSINSIKRLNNDSLAKFSDWTTYFGAGQTVVAAVLEGVYDLGRLVAAQKAGAVIVWSHNLEALTAFVQSTK